MELGPDEVELRVRRGNGQWAVYVGVSEVRITREGELRLMAEHGLRRYELHRIPATDWSGFAVDRGST